MVAHVEVPGAHTVTVVNRKLGPEFTVRAATFGAGAAMVLPPLPPVPVDEPLECLTRPLTTTGRTAAAAGDRHPQGSHQGQRQDSPEPRCFLRFCFARLIVSPRPGRPRAAGRGHKPSRCMPACVHPTAPPVQAPGSGAVLDAARFSPPQQRARIERSKRQKLAQIWNLACHATPNTLPAGETYSRTTCRISRYSSCIACLRRHLLRQHVSSPPSSARRPRSSNHAAAATLSSRVVPRSCYRQNIGSASAAVLSLPNAAQPAWQGYNPS